MTQIMEPNNARRFSELPDEAVIRIETVLWLFDNISRSKWYAGIKEGKYPKPLKMGRASRWKVADIRAALNQLQPTS
jgi:prophage regulatory protein